MINRGLDLSVMGMLTLSYRKLSRYNSLFDEDGNKISEITMHPQKASWTDHNYSPDGRIESQLTRTGRTVRYSYNGRRVTTDDNGRCSSQQLDSWGNVLTQTDPENTEITHRYNSNGQPVSTTVGSHTITMAYDDKGNQLKLNDPDIGEIRYTYDAFSRLKSFQSPTGSYTLTYDTRGRVKQKAYASRVVDYSYYDSGNGVSLLKRAQADNGTSDEYTYNEYGQVLSRTQTTDSHTFEYLYAYDSWGRMIRQTSPNGYVQNYTYSDADSHLQCVTDANNRVLWQYVTDIPGIRQVSLSGNNVVCVTSSSEDETERSISYTCDNWPLLKFGYRLDPLLGNVIFRSETSDSNSFTESFFYDQLDRLIRVEGGSGLYMDYAPNGNITCKSDVGAYRYDSGRPHAVSDIEDPTAVLTSKPGQQITYTEFNKVETIREGEYEMRFTYGPDEERVKSVLYCDGSLYRTVYYGSGFDLMINRSGKVIERSYLGDQGTFGMVRRDASSGRESTYYFHCDLLGSLCAVTNYQGDIVERRSYDAWGRHRDPYSWSDYACAPEMSVTSLGYIFQEEMPEFGLINLNGRLYDPLLGRMLSPDPYIQDIGNSQNYNRYSYCWNNPMKYTDPSGNFILGFIFPGIGSVIDAMLWSGLSYSIQAQDGWDFGDFFDSMSKGGILSALSMGFSTVIGDALGHSVGSLGKELIRAGLHGSVGGMLGLASGSSFLDGFSSSALSSLVGSGMQSLGISDAALLGVAGAVSGGVAAALSGSNWSMAAFQGFMVGALNHGQEDPPVKLRPSLPFEMSIPYRLCEVTVTAQDLSQIKNIRAAIAVLAIGFVGVDQRSYGHYGQDYVDCSKFSQEMYGHFGFNIPRNVTGQIEWFKKNGYFSTDPSQIQPGDLVFYENCNHVGVATMENGRFGIANATVNKGNNYCIKFNQINSKGQILNNGGSTWRHRFVGFGRLK